MSPILFMLIFFNFRCACHLSQPAQLASKKKKKHLVVIFQRLRKKLDLYYLFYWRSNKKWILGLHCKLIIKNILSQSNIRFQMWQSAVSHTTHDSLRHELVFFLKKERILWKKITYFARTSIFSSTLLKPRKIQSYMFSSLALLLLDLGAVHANQNNFLGDFST